MKYIDLFIEKIINEKESIDTNEQCFLSNIIENHQVSIALSSPGSGKTSNVRVYYIGRTLKKGLSKKRI